MVTELFGQLSNYAISDSRHPQFHEVSVNESLGSCSRTDIVRTVESNFSDEIAVLANEAGSGHAEQARCISAFRQSGLAIPNNSLVARAYGLTLNAALLKEARKVLGFRQTRKLCC